MALVVGLSIDDEHRFSKRAVASVTAVAGVGIEGDTHAGPLVQHRSRVRADPNQPNLRQVHLIDDVLFRVAADAGFEIGPGDLGENVTTSGVDLHALAAGSVLLLGEAVLVAVTGLRNPCAQIERFRPGLLDLVRWRDDAGEIVRCAGVMGVVVRGGEVVVGDPVTWSVPPGPPSPLRPV
ncbi:MAG: MOSC domain-containing protein [Ilumatobacteraceae bacterium]